MKWEGLSWMPAQHSTHLICSVNTNLLPLQSFLSNKMGKLYRDCQLWQFRFTRPSQRSLNSVFLNVWPYVLPPAREFLEIQIWGLLPTKSESLLGGPGSLHFNKHQPGSPSPGQVWELLLPWLGTLAPTDICRNVICLLTPVFIVKWWQETPRPGMAILMCNDRILDK